MTQKKAILVVDDEEPIRRLVKNCLASKFDCTAACNGQEAIGLLRTTSFDIVITDIHMPGMTGFELCKYVFNSHPNAVVIIMTGYPEFLEEAESMRVGIFTMPKPFSGAQLRSTVEHAIRAHALQASAKSDRPALSEADREIQVN